MPERRKIKSEIAALAKTLDRLTAEQNTLCGHALIGRVATETTPGLAELEEVRSKAEDLKRELAALKDKSKLDPEVRDLEAKLENILNRYYWLWQKCRTSMA